MLFNTAAALSINGTFNLGRPKDCKGMMYICLVFFVLTKTSVQLFLIERAHAVRANVRDRLHDWVWLTFVFILVVGFGTIAILGFMAPVGVVGPDDGQCRIGLPRTSLLVLMTYDILISVALTVVFLVLLHKRLLVSLSRLRPSSSRVKLLHDVTHSQNLSLPVLRVQKSHDTRLSDSERSSGRSAPSMTSLRTKSAPTDMTAIDAQTKRLRLLVAKSITGAIVMLVATTLNLGLLRTYHYPQIQATRRDVLTTEKTKCLYPAIIAHDDKFDDEQRHHFRYNGMEHGYLCFACCLVDVTWSVAVIHLLTENPHDDRPALMSQLHSSEARGARIQRMAAMRRAQGVE
ncbi:hypothetical protein LTR17_011023 [Elasticomyces elasticus]|nr:hypothetical protein LTR17_011023 [Elasticomyces elasticus]